MRAHNTRTHAHTTARAHAAAAAAADADASATSCGPTRAGAPQARTGGHTPTPTHSCGPGRAVRAAKEPGRSRRWRVSRTRGPRRRRRPDRCRPSPGPQSDALSACPCAQTVAPGGLRGPGAWLAAAPTGRSTPHHAARVVPALLLTDPVGPATRRSAPVCAVTIAAAYRPPPPVPVCDTPLAVAIARRRCV